MEYKIKIFILHNSFFKFEFLQLKHCLIFHLQEGLLNAGRIFANEYRWHWPLGLKPPKNRILLCITENRRIKIQSIIVGFHFPFQMKHCLSLL